MTTAPRLDPKVRAEIVRRLLDDEPAYRVAKEVGVWPNTVRAIRDEQKIPPKRAGSNLPSKPKPVIVDDPAEVDGDPKTATPRRIPPGQWCIERPNQAQWMAMLAAASRVERTALRIVMCWVLDLPATATDIQLEDALRAERRTAEELAGLYIKARGYGR